MTKKTPSEIYLKKQIITAEKTAKMEKELSSFGRPVPAGYMMTVGDMQNYFRSVAKRKRK